MNSSNNNKGINMSDLYANLPTTAAAAAAAAAAGFGASQSNQASQADMVNALKDKIQSMAAGRRLENLSPEVKKRVEVLKGIQSEHDELEKKYHEEKAALEAKYLKQYEPLYAKRYEIVTGVTEVEGAKNEASTDMEVDKSGKGVPDFWLIAMKNNDVLAEEITENDEGALKYLKDIKWCRIDDPRGFTLEFFFEANPYFKNPVLTKTYHMIDDNEPILEKAIGTEIEWFPGKCLTQKVLKKKPRKGSKNLKPITKTEKCDSFFNFFNPPEVPEDDEDIDEEIAEDLQNEMEQDYDIGSTIRDKIIPHAVSWFTGEAVEGGDFEDIDDNDDDEEDDDDDEDEEDEDDDEEEDKDEEKSRKKNSFGPKGTKAPAAQGEMTERPPECKQQ